MQLFDWQVIVAYPLACILQLTAWPEQTTWSVTTCRSPLPLETSDCRAALDCVLHVMLVK